ncbi:TonB-dependent receptor [Glaciecola sp. SC05]|uniref:TonB-dependent receptor n=1 Tax=Glaciecola sp. SC05 TaxID=1987355 RepID=UPI0035297AC6
MQHKNLMKKSIHKCLIATSVAVALSASALAQESSSDETPAVEDFEKITVTGVRGSLNRALGQKRQSVGVSDVISAEDLGKFPDLNISESLQRIPGVTLNRNSNGEGQAINLRGLGPQFTRVELNGMSGTGNGSGGRFGTSSGERGFNFELLAAELFSYVEVAKSPSASQVEGGMAGLVSLETPKPLSYDGLNATVSAQGNYSELTGDIDPRGSFLISQNIDDVFGIAFSLALSETNFRSDTAEAGSWRPGSSFGRGDSDALLPNGTRYYNFLESRDTLGSTLTIQYRPTNDLEFKVDAIYANLDSERIANRNDMPIENPGPVVTLNEQNGVATSGSVTGVQQRVGTNFIATDEEFFQLSAGADWTPNDDWRIRPYIGYSNREADRQFDLYSFRLADENGFDPGTVSFDVRGDFVDFSSTETDFTANPEDFLFNIFILRPSTDEDEELAAKLDFERYFDVGGLTSVEFGFRYADREKTRIQTQERLQRNVDDIRLVPNLSSVATLLPFEVSGANAPSQQLAADPALIRSIFYPGGNAVNGTFIRPLPGFDASESWSVEETTFNAYVQANFEIEDVQFNIGLRLVDTEQTSNGNTVANRFQPTEQITPVSITSDYTRYLPSFNLKYDVTDELVMRAAYSTTLTRPNLSSLAPSETVNGIDEGGGTGSTGNPNLEPFTADNFDLGLEWYFAEESLLSANLFYKDIGGLIDTTSFTETRSFPRQADGVIVSAPIVFTSFENGVSAEIKGLELSYQQPIAANFGVIVNYTYADSSADFGAEGDVRTTGLPGLSRSSYNASIYFDNGALDARLSYAWRERYLADFTDDFGIPRFTDDFGQLDFSANYSVNDNLQLQLQILNITNEQVINQSTALFLPYGVNDLDRRVLFGARYSF